MSNDPFKIGKIEGNKAGQANPLPQLNRAGEAGATGAAARAGGAAPAAAASTATTDQVSFSQDVGDTESAGGNVPNLAAWSDGGSGGGGFAVSQGPEPGMQSGAVIGAGGISGLDPGMQAGGVFTPRHS